VRSTASYAQLSDAEWRWCLEFVGGAGAGAGAERLSRVPTGAAPTSAAWLRVADEKIARRHRMSVGTIVAESAMLVRLRNGKRLGTIEEGFIARLHPGGVFVFAGRLANLGLASLLAPGSGAGAWAACSRPPSALPSTTTVSSWRPPPTSAGARRCARRAGCWPRTICCPTCSPA